MRLIPRFYVPILPAFLIAWYTVVAQSQRNEQKIDPRSGRCTLAMLVDSDGTLHFGPRSVPSPALESPDARRSYVHQMLQRARTSVGRSGLASVRILEGKPEPGAAGGSKETALKIYPVTEESRKIGGVGVTIYSPREIPAKNRKKVLMEFEMDAEAIAVASLGQLKVIKVNDRGGGPSIPGNEDIVAVYRELLFLEREGIGVCPRNWRTAPTERIGRGAWIRTTGPLVPNHQPTYYQRLSGGTAVLPRVAICRESSKACGPSARRDWQFRVTLVCVGWAQKWAQFSGEGYSRRQASTAAVWSITRAVTGATCFEKSSNLQVALLPGSLQSGAILASRVGVGIPADQIPDSFSVAGVRGRN